LPKNNEQMDRPPLPINEYRAEISPLISLSEKEIAAATLHELQKLNKQITANNDAATKSLANLIEINASHKIGNKLLVYQLRVNPLHRTYKCYLNCIATPIDLLLHCLSYGNNENHCCRENSNDCCV
jgi:hypothetical protein